MNQITVIKADIVIPEDDFDDMQQCYQRLSSHCKPQEVTNTKLEDYTIGHVSKILTAQHHGKQINQINQQNNIVLQKKQQRATEEQDYEYEKLRQLCTYEDAPNFLKFNPYIRDGYRKELPTKLCFESIFWWTNETINIWSHLIGWLIFVSLTYTDINFLSAYASFEDKIIIGALLVCFQVCLILSTIYHTFSCRSAEHFDCFLSYDICGIAMSLVAIYLTGIYYAFWCQDSLRNFYTITVGLFFGVAMALQIPRLKITDNVKMMVLLAWAIYGIIPTCHWYYEMGGLDNEMVKLFIPRVFGMYFFTGLAFLIYFIQFPERWFSGRFDYLGHSHNWWHILVLIAFYYWHHSAIEFLQYRITNGCTAIEKTLF